MSGFSKVGVCPLNSNAITVPDVPISENPGDAGADQMEMSPMTVIVPIRLLNVTLKRLGQMSWMWMAMQLRLLHLTQSKYNYSRLAVKMGMLVCVCSGCMIILLIYHILISKFQ